LILTVSEFVLHNGLDIEVYDLCSCDLHYYYSYYYYDWPLHDIEDSIIAKTLNVCLHTN